MCFIGRHLGAVNLVRFLDIGKCISMYKNISFEFSKLFQEIDCFALVRTKKWWETNVFIFLVFGSHGKKRKNFCLYGKKLTWLQFSSISRGWGRNWGREKNLMWRWFSPSFPSSTLANQRWEKKPTESLYPTWPRKIWCGGGVKLFHQVKKRTKQPLKVNELISK